jgi:hypothetical protein
MVIRREKGEKVTEMPVEQEKVPLVQAMAMVVWSPATPTTLPTQASSLEGPGKKIFWTVLCAREVALRARRGRRRLVWECMFDEMVGK